MARAIDLNCPLIFDPKGDSTNLESRWKKWKKGFELYIIASGIENGVQKRALILHCAGEDIQEIVETFNDPVDTYKRLVQALDKYFLPKQNKRYERHIFRQCNQKEDESIAQYATRLTILAKTCEFADVQDEIVDQVIEKCRSHKLRKRLLRETELDLTKTIEIAQIAEAMEVQSREYKKDMTTKEAQSGLSTSILDPLSARCYVSPETLLRTSFMHLSLLGV